MPDPSVPFTNHIIVLGWDALAHHITRQLVIAGRKVVVITHQTDVRDVIRDAFSPDDVRVHLSQLNDWSTFDQVNIEESYKVFVNLDNEEDSLVAILNLKALYDGLEFDVVLENQELEETFYAAGVTYAVSTQNLASKLTASHLFEPEVAAYTSDLLSASDAADAHDMQEYELLDEHDHVGQTWGDLFWTLKEQFNCVPIGLGRSTETGARELRKIPADDTPLRAGDHVVLITSSTKEDVLESFFGIDEGTRRQ